MISPTGSGTWGRFGKLHVRLGKGARGSGPRERMVPLINDAGVTLRWFVQDVWFCFDCQSVGRWPCAARLGNGGRFGWMAGRLEVA